MFVIIILSLLLCHFSVISTGFFLNSIMLKCASKREDLTAYSAKDGLSIRTMGCGASSNVVPAQETANGHGGKAHGNGVTNGGGDHGDRNDHREDSLPTVILTETPVKAKPPIAFEIPLEDFDGGKRPNTPPAHLQRLLQPPQAEISLPVIEEKLAEAEQRRQSILQQRAASAQKRTQKILKAVHDLGRLDNLNTDIDSSKHSLNTLSLPPEPGAWEDKNIS